MVELDVLDNWAGKNLIELNLRKKYGLNIVAIRKNGEVQVDVNPEEPLNTDMKLIVIANVAKLSKLR